MNPKTNKVVALPPAQDIDQTYQSLDLRFDRIELRLNRIEHAIQLVLEKLKN